MGHQRLLQWIIPCSLNVWREAREVPPQNFPLQKRVVFQLNSKSLVQDWVQLPLITAKSEVLRRPLISLRLELTVKRSALQLQ